VASGAPACSFATVVAAAAGVDAVDGVDGAAAAVVCPAVAEMPPAMSTGDTCSRHDCSRRWQ